MIDPKSTTRLASSRTHSGTAGTPGASPELHKSFGLTDVSWSEAPFIVGSGLCMGTADVVPGVSGGTMAVALGIYRQLLAAIASLNVHALRALLRLDLRAGLGIVHWRFLMCLMAGIGLAIVIMLKVLKLPLLIATQPTLVYAVFFGLVLASCLILARKIPVWSISRVSLLVAGVVAGFLVVNLVPVETPEHPGFVFLSGTIAICAMLLPGISGSFVLLILGKYTYIIGSLEQLLHLDLTQLRIILPFALGCAFGIAAFSRFLAWLLHRWQYPVLAALTGLLVGSLWRIWPYQHLVTEVVRGKERIMEAKPYLPDAFGLGVAALMAAGFAVVLIVEYIASRRRGASGVV